MPLLDDPAHYHQIYRGLPAEIRLEIWRYLVPSTTKLTRVTHRSAPLVDEIYGGKITEDTMRCRFEPPLHLALRCLDRTTRAEILSLYTLTIDTRDLSALERNNFLNNAPPHISPFINEIQLKTKRKGIIENRVIIHFLETGRIGPVLRHASRLHVFHADLELHVVQDRIGSLFQELRQADFRPLSSRSAPSSSSASPSSPSRSERGELRELLVEIFAPNVRPFMFPGAHESLALVESSMPQGWDPTWLSMDYPSEDASWEDQRRKTSIPPRIFLKRRREPLDEARAG